MLAVRDDGSHLFESNGPGAVALTVHMLVRTSPPTPTSVVAEASRS